MKLIHKYNQTVIPILLVLFMVSSLFSYFLSKQIIENEVDNSIKKLKKGIESYVATNNSLPTLNQISDQMVVFDPKTPRPKFTEFSTAYLYFPLRKKIHPARQLKFPLKVNETAYQATISLPLEGESHLINLIIGLGLFTILSLIGIFIIINKIISKRIWKPFYDSIQELKEFDIQNPKPFSSPFTQIEEFDFLIKNLNSLTSLASENYRILKEFTENASHEIQTPLSIIRSKLDLVIQNEGLSKKELDSLKTAYLAIKKLSNLNKDLLLITKIENHQFKEVSPIDLQLKIQDKIEDFRELIELNQIQLFSDVHESTIVANPVLIEILVNNVLSNAMKHNTKNGFIDIQLKSGRLSISNSGEESSLDESRLFQRFYKSNNTGSNNGLGLSIIKQICDISKIKALYNFSLNRHLFEFIWE